MVETIYISRVAIVAAIAVSSLLAEGGGSEEAASSKTQKPHTSFSFDLGRIQKGKYEQEPISGQMIQRTSVTLRQTMTVGDRLEMTMGVGGLFWYATPETRDFHRHFPKFGPGVEQAQGVLKMGPLDDTWGRLRFGLVPFKYNPDAKNLGEYLLRSGAYPNILVTGGWSIINSAGILMQGADLEGQTGNFRHNLLLTMERGMEPLYDLTPAYLVSWTPGEAVEIGAGAAFAHLVSARPSLTTPDGPADPLDPINQPLGRYQNDTLVTDTAQRGYSNYTFKAIKLMARASLDLQSFISAPLLGPQDLKLYAEAAVLGVQDYPYYYDNVLRRIPVMVGFNLPAFRWLDVLSLEMEYRRPEFANSTRISYEYSSMPLPDIPVYQVDVQTPTSYAQNVRHYDKNSVLRQGIKWSVYAKRSLGQGFKVYAQAASDYLRGIDYRAYPVSLPLTRTPSDWYFLVRLELGI